MSPTQCRLLSYLRLRSPSLVGGYELRDEVMPSSGVKGVHVQVHRLRAAGIAINSIRGPRGGYQMEISNG